MRYGLKYIQEDAWATGTKSERGYEAWITSTIDKYSRKVSAAKLYSDINAAYIAQNCHSDGGGWYYIVEAVEEDQ